MVYSYRVTVIFTLCFFLFVFLYNFSVFCGCLYGEQKVVYITIKVSIIRFRVRRSYSKGLGIVFTV